METCLDRKSDALHLECTEILVCVDSSVERYHVSNWVMDLQLRGSCWDCVIDLKLIIQGENKKRMGLEPLRRQEVGSVWNRERRQLGNRGRTEVLSQKPGGLFLKLDFIHSCTHSFSKHLYTLRHCGACQKNPKH